VTAPGGRLVPATIDYRQEVAVRTGTEAGVVVTGAEPRPGAEGMCFTSTAQTRVEWALPKPVSGGPLVVRTAARSHGGTPVRVVVAGAVGGYAPANFDSGKGWFAGSSGSLDTVAVDRVDRVVLDSFSPGREMCLSSLAVGVVRR